MRVAIVHPGLSHRRGAERVVVGLARSLAARGHTVSVITGSYDPRLHGEPRDFEFRVVELGGPGWGSSSLAEQWRFGRQLAPLLTGYDVVNVHGHPALSWVAFAAASSRDVPPIVWLCNEPPRLLYDALFNQHAPQLLNGNGRRPQVGGLAQARHLRGLMRQPGLLLPQPVLDCVRRGIDRLQVRRVFRIICNSHFAAELTRRIYPGASVSVCHLGGAFDDGATGCDTSQRYCAPMVLTVSPLHQVKNVEVVLRALALLRDETGIGDLTYVVAGQGPDRARLRTLAQELGLSSKVEFRGFVSDEELRALYGRATVVAYLPLDEPFGLVFVEAMAAGKPVLGPNHGGATEIVVDGLTGRLVDPLVPRAVAEALLAILDDPDDARAMGQRGYERYRSCFTFEAFVDRFEPLLTSGAR